MNVGELKDILRDVPDDAKIWIEIREPYYGNVSAFAEDADVIALTESTTVEIYADA